jgi:hypothetical protein
MSAGASSVSETRQQRIEAILEQLRPKIDAVVRQLVERAVDVPEAEEFGAIDAEHRMLYTALLYTPDKEPRRYLVDFDLQALAQQVRWQGYRRAACRGWKT